MTRYECNFVPMYKTYIEQSMKIVTVSVQRIWDRLVIYWHALVERKQWSGPDTITYHLPSKTPKGKKDALKTTAPQSKHYKQTVKGQFLSHKLAKRPVLPDLHITLNSVQMCLPFLFTLVCSFLTEAPSFENICSKFRWGTIGCYDFRICNAIRFNIHVHRVLLEWKHCIYPRKKCVLMWWN